MFVPTYISVYLGGVNMQCKHTTFSLPMAGDSLKGVCVIYIPPPPCIHTHAAQKNMAAHATSEDKGGTPQVLSFAACTDAARACADFYSPAWIGPRGNVVCNGFATGNSADALLPFIPSTKAGVNTAHTQARVSIRGTVLEGIIARAEIDGSFPSSFSHIITGARLFPNDADATNLQRNSATLAVDAASMSTLSRPTAMQLAGIITKLPQDQLDMVYHYGAAVQMVGNAIISRLADGIITNTPGHQGEVFFEPDPRHWGRLPVPHDLRVFFSAVQQLSHNTPQWVFTTIIGATHFIYYPMGVYEHNALLHSLQKVASAMLCDDNVIDDVSRAFIVAFHAMVRSVLDFPKFDINELPSMEKQDAFYVAILRYNSAYTEMRKLYAAVQPEAPGASSAV